MMEDWLFFHAESYCCGKLAFQNNSIVRRLPVVRRQALSDNLSLSYSPSRAVGVDAPP